MGASYMARWITAAELSKIFVVGSERLLEFARRGDLPCHWDQQGRALFDSEYASTLFRRRGVALAAHAEPHLGVLGSVRLGPAPALDPIERSESVKSRTTRAA